MAQAAAGAEDHGAEEAGRKAQFAALRNQMQARGLLADSEQLQPARTARTVRCWDGGDVDITAGLPSRAREQLTAWLILEVRPADEIQPSRTTSLPAP